MLFAYVSLRYSFSKLRVLFFYQFIQLHLEAASGSILPRNGDGVITQNIKITNSMHGQVRFLQKVFYDMNVCGSITHHIYCSMLNEKTFYER